MESVTEIEVPQQPRWYWAALGVMVRNHYRSVEPKYTQCRLAELLLGRHGCCDDIKTCDTDYEVEATLRQLNHLGRVNAGGLDLITGDNELARGNMVIFQFKVKKSGGIPRIRILLHCAEAAAPEGEGPVPIVYSVQLGDLQTGRIETLELDYPAKICPDCETHYITAARK